MSGRAYDAGESHRRNDRWSSRTDCPFPQYGRCEDRRDYEDWQAGFRAEERRQEDQREDDERREREEQAQREVLRHQEQEDEYEREQAEQEATDAANAECQEMIDAEEDDDEEDD